jgi:metal-responsive CopG/Arc/MetJ family transcriptional regulator
MKSVVVGVRLSQDVKDKLQQLADEEHRSLSNLISKILLDYLKVKKEKPTEQSADCLGISSSLIISCGVIYSVFCLTVFPEFR